MKTVPSEKYAARRGSVSDARRMITASFPRALQRETGRICVHVLLTFQEVMPISKTRNQLLDLTVRLFLLGFYEFITCCIFFR